MNTTSLCRVGKYLDLMPLQTKKGVLYGEDQI